MAWRFELSDGHSVDWDRLGDGYRSLGQVLAPLLAVAAGWSNVALFIAVGVAPLLRAVAILRLTRDARWWVRPNRLERYEILENRELNEMTETISQPVLHHVNLKTTRLQEMIDWYGAVVGSKPNFQFPGGAWLSNDGANHRIALLTSSKMKDDPDKLVHTGMHHIAFEYETCDELLNTFSRLWTLGIKPHMSLDHGMTTSFYYVDPDGNSVELQYDNFGDWEQSSEWMRTSPEFASNPIGVPVDPAKMVEARKGGASREDLHRRAFAAEFLPAEPFDPRVPLD